MPRKKKTKPMGLLFEINTGIEVFRIHRNERGIFMTFGAETDKASNMYEMDLSDEQVTRLKGFVKGL